MPDCEFQFNSADPASQCNQPAKWSVTQQALTDESHPTPRVHCAAHTWLRLASFMTHHNQTTFIRVEKIA